MYRILKGYGRLKSDIHLIDELDETKNQLPLKILEERYANVYWVIDIPAMDFKPHLIRLSKIPIEYIVEGTKTLEDYLNDQYVDEKLIKKIPWEEEIPEYRKGEVYFWDGHSREFDYKSINLTVHEDIPIPEEDKPDLLVTREGLDYRLGKYCLLNLNGFFHYFDTTEKGWLIREGNKTRTKNIDDCHLGVMDFSQIGEVMMVPFNDEMIRPANTASKLSDNIYIDISRGTKVDLRGKTIGYVLGGYLHLLDHTYRRIADNIIKIDFNHINWETLYYQMKQHLDVSPIGLTDYGNDRVLGFEMYHDSTIRNLLKLKQSFLVIIDNPYIGIEEYLVGHTGLPHRYESAIPPVYPLRIGEGRYLPYKAIKNYNRWSIATQNNILPLQVRYQREQDTFHMLHDRIYPLEGEVYASAHYQRITSEILVKPSDGEIPEFNILNEDIENNDYYHLPCREYMSQE